MSSAETALEEQAAALLAGEDDAEPCQKCGQPIGRAGAWFADETGLLLPYCRRCAMTEFPVT